MTINEAIESTEWDADGMKYIHLDDDMSVALWRGDPWASLEAKEEGVTMYISSNGPTPSIGLVMRLLSTFDELRAAINPPAPLSAYEEGTPND